MAKGAPQAAGNLPAMIKSADLSSAALRELLIKLGHAGYLALFEILDEEVALVLAVRHQRENGYH